MHTKEIILYMLAYVFFISFHSLLLEKKTLKVGMANVTECSKKSTPRMSNPWPLRIKLTNDRMLWDSIKISSKEFEEFILGQMNESSRKSLESWIPVNILIYDVDNCETYDAKLFKKESFWFDPMPVLGEKPKKGESMKESSSYSLEKARKEFAYSIEPFRQIIRKRGLKYDQEIGLRYCGGQVVVAFEFSVLHSSLSDFSCFKL
ncbi:hypothetical protein AAZX31_03G218900 [Glycine max]|nr:hypothetical protein GLYMA_03G239100v4 [Glycine max]